MTKIDEISNAINDITNYYVNYAKLNNMSYTRLAIICHAYEKEVSQMEISKFWILPKQTVNNEAIKLINEGYLEIVNTKDKRIKLLKLTNLGIKKYENIIKHIKDTEDNLIKEIGINKLEETLKGLNLLKDYLKNNL